MKHLKRCEWSGRVNLLSKSLLYQLLHVNITGGGWSASAENGVRIGTGWNPLVGKKSFWLEWIGQVDFEDTISGAVKRPGRRVVLDNM